jgi:N-carbamoyl-L-amino-acid hydrolase
MPATWNRGTIVPHAYLELHIEQGPVLEAEGTADRRRRGPAGHLLAEGHHHRRGQPCRHHADAAAPRRGYAAAAMHLLSCANRCSGAAPATTLATTGSLRWSPDLGQRDRAPRHLHGRPARPERRSAAGRRGSVWPASWPSAPSARGCRSNTERLVRFEPVVFDAAWPPHRGLGACMRRGLSHRRMTSGAGHDAQMIARIAPAAMIFVPSRGGISHNPREHTDETS